MKKLIGTLCAVACLTVGPLATSRADAGAPRLPAQCRKTISFTATAEDQADAALMRDKIEVAKMLSALVVLSPFAAAFDPNSYKMSWNITQAPWDAWSAAMTKLPDGLRGILRKTATEIRAKYVFRNDRERDHYWACVERAF